MYKIIFKSQRRLLQNNLLNNVWRYNFSLFSRLFKSRTNKNKQEETISQQNNLENIEKISDKNIEKNTNKTIDITNTNMLNKQETYIKDIINTEKKSLEELSKKYELYKDYHTKELLKRDEDFGEIITYDEFLDKGLDQFETGLTKYYEHNLKLENNKDFKELMNIVDSKTKKYYSNFKEEYKYKLENYEERWYKESVFSRKKDAHNELTAENMTTHNTKRTNKVRNHKEYYKEMGETAFEPEHPIHPTRVKTQFEVYTDFYSWLEDCESQESKNFITFELIYAKFKMARYFKLENLILEEFYDRSSLSAQCPIQASNNSIIFRKDGDTFSIYKTDNINIPAINRGFQNEIKDVEFNNTELIFGLKDFINLNKVYDDINFLDFSKRILDRIEDEDDCLIDFFLSPNEDFLILVLDMQNEAKSYDLIIKDIKNDILLPIIIYNTDGLVSFDKNNGIFYTQIDLNYRPCKVFRHQIGTPQKSDVLIYNEKSKDYKVKTYNCKSNDYTYIEIFTSAEPHINEIWFKPTNDLGNTDFNCIKQMARNTYYSVKHCNGAFYLLINKADSYDKELKKIIINQPKFSGHIEYSNIKNKQKEKEVSNNDKPSQTNVIDNIINNIDFSQANHIEQNNKQANNHSNLVFLNQKPNININTNNHNEVEEFIDLMTLGKNTKDTSLIKIVSDIISVDDNVNIIDYLVFKNYLVTLEESAFKRFFRVLNFKANKFYTHEPIINLTNLKFIDNYAFDCSYFRYSISSPVETNQYTDYSMGTRKNYLIYSQKFKKYNPEKYTTEVIYIKDRDDTVTIPIMITYKKDLYNSESLFIVNTSGSQSTKESLDFDIMKISLLDRGFVFVTPQVRGTKYFDFNWYNSGIQENKLRHFTDYIDVTLYLRNQLNAKSILLYGEGYSGALTAALAMMQQPDYYSLVVLVDGAYDLLDYCKKNSSDIKVLEEFGDIKNKDCYELIKLYSPYHLQTPTYHPPMLISSSMDSENYYQSLKFVAKFRKKNITSMVNNVFLDLNMDKYSEEEKRCFIYSFIVGKRLLK